MSDLALDVIRKKVFFHNSIDVWISACDENNIDWFNAEDYKKFIGTKGLGFLSILEVAHLPEIYSGPFNFMFSIEKSKKENESPKAE